jgi:hypothetical protein
MSNELNRRPERHSQCTVPHRPVELDEHCGMAAQKSTELHRRLWRSRPIRPPCSDAKIEFESYAVAGPSATWPEAAARAEYGDLV